MRYREFAASMLLVAAFLGVTRTANGQTVYVGNSAELRAALRQAKAGHRILLRPGRYSGEMIYSNLQGTPEQEIYIGAAVPEAPPTIAGGGTGLQLQSPTHLTMENLIFENAAVNGINIDDGDRPDQPGHHVVLRNITVRGETSSALHNGLKLSRVNDLRIENYQAHGWGREGQAVNMIGCLRGEVTGCQFDGQNKSKVGVQIKGGSRDIHLTKCKLFGITDRVIQIGGTTGKKFFTAEPVSYEAADITVENCELAGGEAAIAFVGINGAIVRHNVIYRPRGWVFRILQENNRQDFVPARRGLIFENTIVWNNKDLTTFVDVGQGTEPRSFHFERNAWFCQDAPRRSEPRGLPVAEVDGIYGADPLLASPENGDLRQLRSFEELRQLAQQKRTLRRNQLALAVVVAAALGSTMLLLVRQKNGVFASLRQKLQFTPDHVAFMTPAPALPQRRHLLVMLGVWLVLMTLALLWSFDWQMFEQSKHWLQFAKHPWGTDPSRRFDFIAIAVAFVPGGALAALIMGYSRFQMPQRVLALVIAPPLFALVAFAIEWLQQGVADAVVSRNDVLAALLGSAAGAFAGVTVGPTLVSLAQRLSQGRRHPQPIDWLLHFYLAGLAIYSLMPFDLTLHPIHLYHKFQGGLVQLVPFFGNAQPLLWLLHACLFLPLGMLISIVVTTTQRPVHKLGTSVFACLLVVCALEGVQLFLRSRVVDATQVVTGTAGASLGAWLMSSWGWQNAFLSPLPTNNAALIGARRALAVLLMLATLTAFYAAAQGQ